MSDKDLNMTGELIGFIEKSPSPFHVVGRTAVLLEEAGFSRLEETAAWEIHTGGRYYLTKNCSSILAFAVPEKKAERFLMAASHTDSPTYKIKPDPVENAFGTYQKLSVEGYGGTIASTWLDRPLSAAGRIAVRAGDRIETRLLNLDRDLFLIPNVAIHMNRDVNKGYAFNPAVDMLPLIAGAEERLDWKAFLAKEASCRREDLLGADLYLYNRTPGSIWGAGNEFFSAPRIDNLESLWTTLRGFLGAVDSGDPVAIPLFASFDNEEVGSGTKQGALSAFLRETLDRISAALGLDPRAAVASSFLLSVDNAHARHPNHPELSDKTDAPVLNGGVVIKVNASQKYATDALSSAVFAELCRAADVPVQFFANRSDLPGGSTLGSLADTKVPVDTVDIGLAQLAMHSSYETAGTLDVDRMVRAADAFYRTGIEKCSDGVYRLG